MITLTDLSRREQCHLVQTYDRYPVILESGQGCYLFDPSGKRYLDAITGIGVNALGYAHPRITAVLIEQAKALIHTSNLFYHRYQAELAERLCRMSGMSRAFFSSTGTEAIETALKAARVHASRKRKRQNIVSLRHSFHGRTIGSLAVMGQEGYRAPFEPLTPDVTFVEPNDAEALTEAVSEDTAAVILEPVLGEGGVIPLREDFLRLARDVATNAGALLIVDEIQCGLGRTGRSFAFQWADDPPAVRPDIVVVAKPLAAGLPLAATLFTEDAARTLSTGLHGTTFGGGPLACRVALEFLTITDELLPHIRDVGAYLMTGLQSLRSKHPSIIEEVRGKGLMIGLQLTGSSRSIVEKTLERGLLLNSTHGTVVRVLPPFILSRQQADDIVRTLDEVLSVM